MPNLVAPPMDFDVVREEWNRYQLSDNCLLKIKVVMTKVAKAEGQSKSDKQNYTFDVQNITVALTNERGPPDSHNYSPAEIGRSIVKDDMRFTTVAQDWNEYVVDDGARIRIQPILLKVSKTSKFDGKGVPLYATDLNLNVQIKPPGGGRSDLT